MSPFQRLLQPLRAQLSLPHVRTITMLAGAGIWGMSTWTLIAHEVVTYGASEGPSMYPTLPSKLSYNIISRRHQHGKGVQVGDIVVFSSPISPNGRSCKRIVGMPGDYVVRDDTYSPTVGGASIPGLDEGGIDAVRREPAMVQVPEGHVWVSGDNLPYSRDSRFHGPLPMALIRGKTVYVGEGWFNWTSFRKPQLQPAIQSHAGPVESPGKIALEVT